MGYWQEDPRGRSAGDETPREGADLGSSAFRGFPIVEQPGLDVPA